MTPSVFRSVPCKLWFNYAILSATGYDLLGKWWLDLHKGSASTIAQPKQEEINALVYPGGSRQLSSGTREDQCTFSAVTIPRNRNSGQWDIRNICGSCSEENGQQSSCLCDSSGNKILGNTKEGKDLKKVCFHFNVVTNTSKSSEYFFTGTESYYRMISNI